MRTLRGATLSLLVVFWFGQSGRANELPARPPYLTIFLIDGLSQAVFASELLAGRLPNIQQMIDAGCYVKNGVTPFPSMTGYGFYAYLTGIDAAKSGVLGLRWLDRKSTPVELKNYVGATNVQMNRDLVVPAKTLFEQFPDHYTSSFNSYLNRGVSRSFKSGWAFTAAKYRNVWAPIRFFSSVPYLGKWVFPDWERAEEQLIRHAVFDLLRRPKIQWITLASPDGYHHIYGGDRGYVRLIQNIDYLIGFYRRESSRLGLEVDRSYAVVSDHGMVDVDKNIDLAEPLDRIGIHAGRGPATLFSDRKGLLSEQLKQLDAVIAINGNTLNYLYFCNRNVTSERSWRTRVSWNALKKYPISGRTQDVLATLTGTPGVELVMARDDRNRVHIESAAGEGVIEKQGDRYRYATRGRDPLGYEVGERFFVKAQLEGLTAREWLNETVDSLFPFAVVRAYELLHQAGCGDLVVTASPGYDFGKDFELLAGNYRGGHGGIRRDQSLVPFILAGRGVQSSVRVKAALAEDLGATLLPLLGLKPAATVDGETIPGALSR